MLHLTIGRWNGAKYEIGDIEDYLNREEDYIAFLKNLDWIFGNYNSEESNDTTTERESDIEICQSLVLELLQRDKTSPSVMM